MGKAEVSNDHNMKIFRALLRNSRISTLRRNEASWERGDSEALEPRRYVGVQTSGITLLETVIAIGVILIGVVAVITLIIGSVKAGEATKQEVIGFNMSREGMEIARAIRDDNWLKIEDGDESTEWMSGLLDAAGDTTAIATFNRSTNAWSLAFSPNTFTDVCGNHICSQLFLDNGVYTQTVSNVPNAFVETPYYRLLEIQTLCRDIQNSEATETTLANGVTTCPNGMKKVGALVTSRVRYGAASGDGAEYVLSGKIYNWKPGVSDE